MTTDKKLGEWTYSGACDPAKWLRSSTFETFSVGCFQWVAKNSGKGVKRGKVAKRFSGPVSDPDSVYRAAQAWCDEMNAKETQ